MAKGKAKQIPKWERIEKKMKWDKEIDEHFEKLGFEKGTYPHLLFGTSQRRIY